MTDADSIYLTGRYLDEHPTWHAEDSPWKAAHILRMIEKHNLQPGEIAEVGCGAGEILVSLRNKMNADVELVGYEVSPQAYEIARERECSGLSFCLKDITDSGTVYDLLLVIDVLEHVEDYVGFVRSLRTFGKQLIFHIPLDLSAQTVISRSSLLRTRKDVGHLHYFTEETALATLQDTGYAIEDYFFTARSIELGGGGWKRRLARLPRRLVAAVSESWASRLLGGFSIMVLARPRESE